MYEGFLDERFAEQVMARGTSNVIAGKVVGPAAEAVTIRLVPRSVSGRDHRI
jgi:hypothetical protein